MLNTAAVSAAFPPDAADPDASNDTAQAGFTVKAVVIAPRLAKGEVRDSLAALPPSGDRHTDKSILRAIEEIDKSLDPIRWIDDSTLDPDKGLQVFDREAKAVRELIKVVDKSGPLAGDAQTAVDTLVEIDRRLAQLAIDAITVESLTGAHTYQVVETRIVQPDDTWVATQWEGSWLTLTTCTPRFSSTSRLIVFARLVDGPNAEVIRARFGSAAFAPLPTP